MDDCKQESSGLSGRILSTCVCTCVYVYIGILQRNICIRRAGAEVHLTLSGRAFSSFFFLYTFLCLEFIHIPSVVKYYVCIVVCVLYGLCARIFYTLCSYLTSAFSANTSSKSVLDIKEQHIFVTLFILKYIQYYVYITHAMLYYARGSSDISVPEIIFFLRI